MAARVSLYLSDEAVKNLEAIQEYLEGLTGVKASRSSAMNSLLTRGAGLFMDDMNEVRRVVKKYVPTPPEVEQGEQLAGMAAQLQDDVPLAEVIWPGDTDEEAAE